MAKLFLFGALGLLTLAGAGCSSSETSGAPAIVPGGGSNNSSGGAGSGNSTSGAGGDAIGQAGSSPAGAGSSGNPSGGTTAQGGTSATGGISAQGGDLAVGGAGTTFPPGPFGDAPDFGANVLIFDPATPMATIQTQLSGIASTQSTGSGQFNSNRYTYLFKPGKYQLDVELGFYMQVAGLGQSPDDVQITGAVQSNSKWLNGNATLNFWRSAENLQAVSTNNIWAVSQGTSLRRAHMVGALSLSDGGNSSGGFLADIQVDGNVSSGSQQQFFSRNANWTGWNGGVWNMVFTGVDKPPQGAWPTQRNTIVDKTSLIREKPYLTIDAMGHYFVMVPGAKTDTTGNGWLTGMPSTLAISTDSFYIAKPATDTAATINAALGQGKHLLITPGIYHLDGSIQVTRANTVVFGMGLATLVANTGLPAITIADVDGVKVSGLIIDAGPMNSSTLLEVGPAGSTLRHSANPSSLHDISCRIGGQSAGSATSCVTINSSDLIADNLWLWRADHGQGVGWASNVSKNGLIVNGNNVTIFGLFVEHFQEYQTLWNGNAGRLYFYQSEMPYDPPSQADWQHGTVNGYASYKVADSVTTHEAWGLSVYSAFHNAVVSDNAVETPTAAGVVMHHLMTSWLNGNQGSAISHIINGTGDSASPAAHQAYSAN